MTDYSTAPIPGMPPWNADQRVDDDPEDVVEKLLWGCKLARDRLLDIAHGGPHPSSNTLAALDAIIAEAERAGKPSEPAAVRPETGKPLGCCEVCGVMIFDGDDYQSDDEGILLCRGCTHPSQQCRVSPREPDPIELEAAIEADQHRRNVCDPDIEAERPDDYGMERGL